MSFDDLSYEIILNTQTLIDLEIPEKSFWAIRAESSSDLSSWWYESCAKEKVIFWLENGFEYDWLDNVLTVGYWYTYLTGEFYTLLSFKLNWLLDYLFLFEIGPYKTSTTLVNNFYYNYYIFTYNFSFIYGLKFTLAISFLIFIRAGLPRYRYDFLTKLGWSKFVLFMLFILISTYLIFGLL